MRIISAKYDYEKNDDGTYSVKDGNSLFGKVTGTQIGAIVGKNPWNTEFSIACRLLRLYDEDKGDDPKIRAGVILEPVVLAYCNKHGLPNVPAETLFGKREGAHEDWEQDFDDPTFGGHIDAMTPGGAIVECKTTSDPTTWMKGEIPEHYWLQASLYAKFMKTDKIFFTVAILTPEDVSNPYKFVPSEDNIRIYETRLHPKIDEYIDYCRGWYDKYVKQGVTPVPDLDNPIDAKIVQALDVQKMNIKEISQLMSEYESLLERIDELNDLKKKADNIKDSLAVYMKEHNLNLRTERYYYKYVESTRAITDTEAMKKDGIYDKYTKQSVTKSIKRVK